MNRKEIKLVERILEESIKHKKLAGEKELRKALSD